MKFIGISRGRPRAPMRSRTSFVQSGFFGSGIFASGMADSGEAVESLEEGAPFFLQRRKLLASAGCEAIVAAVAAGLVGLPSSFDPPTLLHFVEQGIEGGEGEFEGSAGAFADLPGDFEAVKRFFGQQGEDGQFAAAA